MSKKPETSYNHHTLIYDENKLAKSTDTSRTSNSNSNTSSNRIEQTEIFKLKIEAYFTISRAWQVE